MEIPAAQTYRKGQDMQASICTSNFTLLYLHQITCY